MTLPYDPVLADLDRYLSECEAAEREQDWLIAQEEEAVQDFGREAVFGVEPPDVDEVDAITEEDDPHLISERTMFGHGMNPREPGAKFGSKR